MTKNAGITFVKAAPHCPARHPDLFELQVFALLPLFVARIHTRRNERATNGATNARRMAQRTRDESADKCKTNEN
jgi:hypothetical protein